MEAATPPPAPAPPPPSGGQPISVGKVISDSFSLYGQNFGVLIGVGLVIAIIVGIINGILNDSDSAFLHFLAWIVQLIGTAVYTGFVVKVVQDVRADGTRDNSVGDLMSAAMPAIGPLIVFGILSGIAIGIGFILLIIPGLFLMTIWSVGSPSIVAEGRGPLEAFGRSWELVKGQAWTVFGVLVCVFLIMVAALIVAGLIGAAIGGIVGAAIVAILVSLVYMPIAALVASTLFFDLGGGSTAAL